MRNTTRLTWLSPRSSSRARWPRPRRTTPASRDGDGLNADQREWRPAVELRERLPGREQERGRGGSDERRPVRRRRTGERPRYTLVHLTATLSSVLTRCRSTAMPAFAPTTIWKPAASVCSRREQCCDAERGWPAVCLGWRARDPATNQAQGTYTGTITMTVVY